MGELQFLEKMLGNIIRPIIRESVEEVIPKYFEKKVQRRYSIKEFCEKFGIAESSFHNWANANGIERIKDAITLTSMRTLWTRRPPEERSASMFIRRKRGVINYNLSTYGKTILHFPRGLRD